jgi:hypothetical protein
MAQAHVMISFEPASSQARGALAAEARLALRGWGAWPAGHLSEEGGHAIDEEGGQ